MPSKTKKKSKKPPVRRSPVRKAAVRQKAKKAPARPKAAKKKKAGPGKVKPSLSKEKKAKKARRPVEVKPTAAAQKPKPVPRSAEKPRAEVKTPSKARPKPVPVPETTQPSAKMTADLLKQKWDHPVYVGFGRPIPPVRVVQSLPYYTLRGTGTWIMVGNPNACQALCTLILFDEKGQALHRRDFGVDAGSTWSLKVLDHADEGIGQSIIFATVPVIVHQQIYRVRGGQILAAATGRTDTMLAWNPPRDPRTYGFTYRTSTDGFDTPVASLIVSNPAGSRLSGYLCFTGGTGESNPPRRLVIEPGCTREIRCPPGHIGVGRLQVADPCGMMLLHLTGNPLEPASIEMIGRNYRADPAPEVRQRQRRIYIDLGHIVSWYRLEQSFWQPLLGLLAGLDLNVTIGNDSPLAPQVLENQDVLVLSAPERPFASSEERVIRDFVSQGGSLLVEAEWGPTPDWTPVTQQVLGLFGASTDENLARDDHHNVYDTPTRIRFEKERNFLPHPIVQDLDVMVTNAGATLTGSDAWTTVVQTSPKAHPPLRPVLITRSFGFGRVCAMGDTNSWIPGEMNRPMDVPLTKAVFEWLLFER